MKFSLRLIASVALLVSVGLISGCGSSNNKGKIVGKWKISGGAGIKEEELKMMEAFKVTLVMEFKEDGTVRMGLEAPPEMQKMLEKGDGKSSASFKYKLLSGDTVEFYDIPKDMQDKEGGGLFGKKDRGKATVKIEGDNMTITDDETKDKPLKLTKMK